MNTPIKRIIIIIIKINGCKTSITARCENIAKNEGSVTDYLPK